MDASDLPPDVDRSSTTLGVHASLTSVAAVVVIVRCIARHTTSGLKPDDYAMVIAMIIAFMNLIFTVIGTYHGTGRHAAYLSLDDIKISAKTIFVGEFLLLVSLCFVKVSVTLFLLGIGGLRKWLRWALLGNLFILCTTTVVFSIVLWVQCRPVQANWDPAVQNPKCLSTNALVAVTYALTGLTIFTDFICAILPLPIIWSLKLSSRTKLSIIAVMGLGFFAAACSIVRITLVKELHKAHLDPTWAVITLGVWTVVELHVAIIVASLPPTRSLVMRVWARILGRPYGETTSASYSGGNSGGRSELSSKPLSVINNDPYPVQRRWERLSAGKKRATDENTSADDIPLRPIDHNNTVQETISR